MAFASVGNDMRVQPLSQQVLGVLAESPQWGVVVKLEFNYWLDGGDMDDPIVVAVPLVDHAGKASQTGGVVREQAGPCVLKHGAGIGECQQGFSGHVSPTSTMVCIDERVE